MGSQKKAKEDKKREEKAEKELSNLLKVLESLDIQSAKEGKRASKAKEKAATQLAKSKKTNRITTYFKSSTKPTTAQHPLPSPQVQDVEMEDLSFNRAEEMEWEDSPYVSREQIIRLEHMKARAVRRRVARAKQSAIREKARREQESKFMTDYLSKELWRRLSAQLSAPTSTQLVNESDIRVRGTFKILTLASREDLTTRSGSFLSRGNRVSWSLNNEHRGGVLGDQKEAAGGVGDRVCHQLRGRSN